MARTKVAPKKRIENTSTAKDVSAKGSKKEKTTILLSQKKWFKDIQCYQKASTCLIPKLPFSRLVKRILLDVVSSRSYLSDNGHTSFQVTKGFLECLQEASEAYLTTFFSDINYLAVHAGRVTIMCKDITLIKTVKKEAYQLLK